MVLEEVGRKQTEILTWLLTGPEDAGRAATNSPATVSVTEATICICMFVFEVHTKSIIIHHNQQIGSQHIQLVLLMQMR